MDDQKKYRIVDIAKLAGVSIGTVDRVLHQRGEVSEVTRKKVLEICQELNFIPDAHASALASRKTYIFGLLIPDPDQDSSFWAHPIRGIRSALNEIMNYGIAIKHFPFDLMSKDSFMIAVRQVQNEKLDGLIISPFFYEESIGLCNWLNDCKIPFVFINSYPEGCKGLSFVGQDAFQSGYLAAKLMHIALQYKPSPILVVNVSKALSNHKHIGKRHDGFMTFFKDLKVDRQHIMINIESNKLDFIHKTLNETLQKNPTIGGIFVPNSKVYAIASYLEKIHRQDMFLIGYDLIEENISYLDNGTIDFLISQRPFEQGYKSLVALYNYLILKKVPDPLQFLPIDILTAENYLFFQQ